MEPIADSGVSRDRYLQMTSSLSYLVMVGGCITIVASAYMVVVCYQPVLYLDQWDEFLGAVRSSTVGVLGQLQWLWSQHNEHRIVIPKLFFLIDWFWFRCKQLFLLTSIFTVQLALVALLGWALRQFGALNSSAWRTGFGMVAFCLFYPSQFDNFITAFQIAFVLAAFCMVAAFCGLLLHQQKATEPNSEQATNNYLVLALLAGIGATYSIASGMLIWPLLIAAALLIHLSLRTAKLISLVATIAIGLYFFHYKNPSGHASPMASLHQPAAVLAYTAVYFGSSWVHSQLDKALVTGLVGFFIAGILLIHGIKKPDAIYVLTMMVALFCLATAATSALGRINFGISQAFASRYQTFALLFWCCLGLLLLARTREHSGFGLPVIQLFCLAVMVSSSSHAIGTIQALRHETVRNGVAATALLADVYDDAALHRLHPNSETVISAYQILKQHHWSIFSGEAFAQFGNPFSQLYTVGPMENCAGSIDGFRKVGVPGHQGFRIEGWAWDKRNQSPVKKIVMVTQDRVNGFAEVGIPRPEVSKALPFVNSTDIGWAGYAQDSSSPIKIYAILNESRPQACYIGQGSPTSSTN